MLVFLGFFVCHFFLALDYFNKHIFCLNWPKKPKKPKSQKKIKKARHDQIKPEKTPKQN
jgi:hypothetical protein